MKGNRKRRIIRKRFRGTSGRCLWCGCDQDADEVTVDHVLSRCYGGHDRSENIVLACQDCNCRRGELPVSVWVFSQRERGVPVNLEDVMRVLDRLSRSNRPAAVRYAYEQMAALTAQPDLHPTTTSAGVC